MHHFISVHLNHAHNDDSERQKASDDDEDWDDEDDEEGELIRDHESLIRKHVYLHPLFLFYPRSPDLTQADTHILFLCQCVLFSVMRDIRDSHAEQQHVTATPCSVTLLSYPFFFFVCIPSFRQCMDRMCGHKDRRETQRNDEDHDDACMHVHECRMRESGSE